jgi:hypothetical protein
MKSNPKSFVKSVQVKSDDNPNSDVDDDDDDDDSVSGPSSMLSQSIRSSKAAFPSGGNQDRFRYINQVQKIVRSHVDGLPVYTCEADTVHIGVIGRHRRHLGWLHS